MQEITRQLGPLTDRVGILSNNFERLFNTNGGPKGFLQSEGEKTDGQFKMVFNILDEHMDEIRPMKDFIKEHTIREQEHEKFQNKRDQEIKDAMLARHEENKEKLDNLNTKMGKKTLIWNIAGVFVAIAALVVAGLGIWIAVRLAKISDLQNLFQPDRQGQVYAIEKRQDSVIPRQP